MSNARWLEWMHEGKRAEAEALVAKDKPQEKKNKPQTAHDLKGGPRVTPAVEDNTAG